MTVEFRVYFVIQCIMFHIVLMLQHSMVGSIAVTSQHFSSTVSVFHHFARYSCDVYNYFQIVVKYCVCHQTRAGKNLGF